MAHRHMIGSEAWFIGDFGRWFRVRVIARDGLRLTIDSLTGWDAERQVPWPHKDGLRFHTHSALYKRLRPPTMRTP